MPVAFLSTSWFYCQKSQQNLVMFMMLMDIQGDVHDGVVLKHCFCLLIPCLLTAFVYVFANFNYLP